MKKFLLILLTVLLVLVLATQYNNNPRLIISRLFQNTPVYSGQLKYRVYLLGFIPMGEAELSAPELEEYNGQKVYHLHARADTFAVYSKFYQAHARIDSYLDLKTFSPILFKQKVSMSGSPDIYKEAQYDQDKGIMTVSGVKRQIFPNTQDPLSAIFRLRHMDFKQARAFEIPINTNHKNYIMKGNAYLKTVAVNRARRDDIVLLEAHVGRRDKNPYHKSSITMVLLSDKENIPLVIKAFTGGILIHARLTEIK